MWWEPTKQDDTNKDRFVSCSTTPDCRTSENFGDLKPLGDLRTCSSHGLSLGFVGRRSSGHYQQKAVSLSHGIGAGTTFQDVAFRLTVRSRNVACFLEVSSFLGDLSGLQELGEWAECHFTGKRTSDFVLAKGAFSLFWKACNNHNKACNNRNRLWVFFVTL